MVASQDSVGRHGYGDEPEWPASDPSVDAPYEPRFDSEFEQFISPYVKAVDFGIYNGGSYHERWYYASARAQIVIPWDMEDEYYEMEEKHKIDTKASDYLFNEGPRGFFARKSGAYFWRDTWKGFKAIQAEFEAVAEDHYKSDKKYQSSEEFWKAKIDATIAQQSLKRPLQGD